MCSDVSESQSAEAGRLGWYLRAGAVREPWVGFEGDHLRVNYEFEFFCRHETKLRGDHVVHFAVALQDGKVLVAARRLRDGQDREDTLNIHFDLQD